ncbi:MAG: HPr family phosphocarrier protein [Pseudomonadota bacterium]
MPKASQRVTIVNKKGLHARASASFARIAGTYRSAISVTFNGLTVNGTHIMDLMLLAAHKGAEIEIIAEGEDAEVAAGALQLLVSNGFGELRVDREEAGREDPERPSSH